MAIYFKGLLYGLVFIFSLGPTFFALFQTALSHGFTRAMAVSLGIIMTDIVFIALIVVGFSSFIEDEQIKFWIGMMGAAVLIIFGISSWIGKKSIKESSLEGKSHLSFWLKGLVLNGFNPLIAVFWVGAVGTTSALGYTVNDQIWFFCGFLTTVLCLDAFKVLMITKLTKFFNDKTLTRMNRIVGSLFIIFGLRLMAYMLEWF